MRYAGVLLAFCLLIAGVLPAQAWMTFVARDVGTGERLGKGASMANDDEDSQLAIVCTKDGLTATFLTGVKLTSNMSADDFPATLALAEQGGEFDMFPVTPEDMVRGDARELRLRFSAEEAMGLAEYVLGAPAGLVVSYSDEDGELVRAEYDADSAPIAIGAVLGECEGR